MTGQHDWQDERLTGQLPNQFRHCPLTGCYFEPCCLMPDDLTCHQLRVGGGGGKGSSGVNVLHVSLSILLTYREKSHLKGSMG